MRSDIREVPAGNGEPLGSNPSAVETIAPGGWPQPGERYRVPARQGRAARLAKGQTIVVINTHGTQVCDFWAFNAGNLSEFLSWEHARAGLSRVLPRPGDALLSNRRRPILTLAADTSPGVHDTLIAACDLFRYVDLGVPHYHDNCADNMRMALAAIGETVQEVPQPFNLWMNIPVRPDWSIDWLPPVAQPGDRLALRAEMDCIAVMSACPQDMIPINGAEMIPKDLHFEIRA